MTTTIQDAKASAQFLLDISGNPPIGTFDPISLARVAQARAWLLEVLAQTDPVPPDPTDPPDPIAA